MSDEQKSYSVQQVARMHGISSSRVRDYIAGRAQPQLPAIKEGAKYLIPAEEHTAWWDKRRAELKPAA